jgi:hypothetical protein
MKYSVMIPRRRYTQGDNPGDWAKINCPSYLSATWYLHEDANRAKEEYYFSNEKDAFWFRMRWE